MPKDMDTDDPLLNAPGRRRGILADALRHTTPPDLMDIPGAVPRPPPKQTSSSRKHPPNPSKQPNPTTSQPSTSRAAAYSPEELAFRQRQGILATALRSYTSVPSLPTATLTRYVVEDTSDDDNRAGMLGMTLKSTKPPLTRRHSHGNVVDQDFEYGTGILGRALSRYSTRESIPKAVENDLGAPKVMKKTVSKKKKPEGTEATISKSPSTMSLVHGAEESLPKTPRNQSPATSEDEAEAEIEELFNLEALTKIDPSAKLLYLAKKNKWGDIEDMLQKRSKLDFSMADKSGYTPLLLAVKHSKLIIIDKLLAHGADLKAMNKERQTALHIAAKRIDRPSCQNKLGSRNHLQCDERLEWFFKHVVKNNIKTFNDDKENIICKAGNKLVEIRLSKFFTNLAEKIMFDLFVAVTESEKDETGCKTVKAHVEVANQWITRVCEKP